MKNFDFLYNTVLCSYLLMKKLTVLLALRHFSWLVSLTPLQASRWLTGLKMAVAVVLWAHATGIHLRPKKIENQKIRAHK